MRVCGPRRFRPCPGRTIILINVNTMCNFLEVDPEGTGVKNLGDQWSGGMGYTNMKILTHHTVVSLSVSKQTSVFCLNLHLVRGDSRGRTPGVEFRMV